MSRLLLGYASPRGQTEKIARYVAAELRKVGHDVDMIEASLLPGVESLDRYDGVIVGAPVHAGKFPRSVRDWASANSSWLARKPSAFFSVCLGILEKENLETQRTERQIVGSFLKEAGWEPQAWTIFAGALHYTRYGFFTRWMMKRISAKAGGDTDTTRDFEYTDWSQVQRFALDFDRVLRALSPKSPAPARERAAQ